MGREYGSISLQGSYTITKITKIYLKCVLQVQNNHTTMKTKGTVIKLLVKISAMIKKKNPKYP